jgi:hypothetical protein
VGSLRAIAAMHPLLPPPPPPPPSPPPPPRTVPPGAGGAVGDEAGLAELAGGE